MFLMAVVSVILAVTNANPLGCCTPSRYYGLLQEIGGTLKENSTTAEAIDVGIFEIAINKLSCKYFIDKILLIKWSSQEKPSSTSHTEPMITSLDFKHIFHINSTDIYTFTMTIQCKRGLI